MSSSTTHIIPVTLKINFLLTVHLIETYTTQDSMYAVKISKMILLHELKKYKKNVCKDETKQNGKVGAMLVDLTGNKY